MLLTILYLTYDPPLPTYYYSLIHSDQSGEGKKKGEREGSLGGGNLSKGISPTGQSVTLSKRMLLNLLAGNKKSRIS